MATHRKAKGRRSFQEIFLDKLTELSNDGACFVSNRNLLESLGWDPNRYDGIKDQLLEEGLITKGRGQGGSVGLTNKTGVQLRVFISYSHKDEKLKDALLKHLQPLKHLSLIDEWNDRKINAGGDWDREIHENLTSSDVILLLVSIDFINSEYCYGIEMYKALELHDSKNAVVVPIILRNCLWQHSPFAKLQALPKDAKAVSSWPDEDEAFTSIAEGIKKLAEAILDNR